jgi:hypothetical protein
MNTLSTRPGQHPRWCSSPSCDAVSGGAHRSTPRIIPARTSAAAAGPLSVQLVQPVGGAVQVSLTYGDLVLELTPVGSRILAAVLRAPGIRTRGWRLPGRAGTEPGA